MYGSPSVAFKPQGRRDHDSSSSSACPELERSGFHEVLPVFSILGASPSRVEAMIMRLEICSQGT